MAYGPQSVSLTREAGGDLDLLEALRGSRGRAKTQQEMLREQSMSPVEIGSYNGIQGKFPISQGLNKIAQGLLATYMDSQARDRAQAAADAQKDEAQKYAAGFAGTPPVAGVDAVLSQRGTVAGPVVDGAVPETPEAANYRIVMDQLRRDQPGQAGDDYQAQAPVFGMPGQRLEAAPGQGEPDDPGVVGRDAVAAQAGTGPTQAQRTAMLMQGYASTNPTVNRMATFLGNQDATDRARQDALDARAFQAKQQRELIAANRDLKSAETQPARDEQARLVEQDKQYRGQAVEFATRYQNATPEDQKKLLIEAQFSANPYLAKGATHIGDLAAKVDASRTSADAKAEVVPPAALKLYSDNQNEYKTSSRNIGQVDRSLQLLDEGKLKFGPMGNAVESVRNYTGMTSEESRNKAEFLNTVDQYTNDILNLAKGPQTDGDARRARDLIRNNLNDPQIVRTQLEKLRGIFANSQDTAGTALNIQGKSLKGLNHVPVSLSQPLAERPKPGTQNSPIVVSSVAEALRLPPGTWITRPDGTIGQVPPR